MHSPAKANEVLSVRPREAARMIGVHKRTLANLTAPRGTIPCVRINRRLTLYAVDDLRAWLADRIHAESCRTKGGV